VTTSPEIGVVIPALGKRSNWLGDAIASIRNAEIHAILVAPKGVSFTHSLVEHVI
jgi:hypothetical protein